MAREINLTSQEWCNIIFEGKNKAYGAYTLRQESSKRHLTAFIMIAVLAVLAFSVPTLTKALGINEQKDHVTDDVVLVDLTKPDKPKEDVIKPQIELPKPPPTLTTVGYTIPKIAPDDQVKEEQQLKSMEEVNKSEGKISVMDNIGTDEKGAVDPKELDRNVKITGGTVEVKEETFEVVEVPPSFPGGDTELMKYLRDNIKYPTIPQENNIQGKVTIQFVVGRDGNIENVEIAKGVDRYLDAEAMRVVKSMPRWIPGKQGGRAVRVKYFVPVNFRLQ